LRREEQRRKRIQEVLAGIRDALQKEETDVAVNLLAEAVSLGAEPSETAALKKKIEKQQRRSRRQQESAAAPTTEAAPRQRSRTLAVGIGIAALVVIGLAVFSMRGPGYDQQIKSAQSYIAQKDFGSAIGVLQQIPQNSPLYGQAQNLLTEARKGE